MIKKSKEKKHEKADWPTDGQEDQPTYTASARDEKTFEFRAEMKYSGTPL